jgi:hypothetical protein
MAEVLNLQTGEPEQTDEPVKRGPGRPKGSTNKTTPDKAGRELRTQLNETFDGLADWRETREDEELAEVFRTDKKAMTDGLLLLTERVPVLKVPLSIFLAVVRPSLAFGRVGRILAGRLSERRNRGVYYDEPVEEPGDVQQAQ